ncbi:MAG: NAD(P)/FAD-dependent oxidoreductase [Nanoarchaeota archaeon]|nr:NAD(P)/FAD-dependent oxidoreductase [Nanoarchaeota archaeon]MBU4283503.1 NAD(P)/FAD-dependent oxidoreductase [Nanoarchaeota archaeon]MBU4493004.1 NAD(P)/FAD-dependent oxidoreductase [Nanoarchaeota archaeon]
MKSHDVVIIGAGPAGLTCAEKLAKADKKVLLLEQNEIIGPKICAGGLSSHGSDYPGLPDKLLEHKYKKIIFHTPFNKAIIKLNKDSIYTIDRKNLGQWQLSKLKKTNAIIKTKSRVTEIKKNHIIINNSEKIRFNYLVGADGSTSIVRKYLGLKTNELNIAIQYVIPTKKYKNLEIFYDSKLFHSWYAWIFPHKNYVSIGCICDPRLLSLENLRKNFNIWLKNNKIDVSKGEYQTYPINCDYKGYRFKNIFLVGDAAGLASGLTGEGIYQATISGEEVAKSIINKNYVSKKMDELVKMKKRHNKILHLVEKSGPFRKVEYELMALLLKSSLMNKKIINFIS